MNTLKLSAINAVIKVYLVLLLLFSLLFVVNHTHFENFFLSITQLIIGVPLLLFSGSAPTLILQLCSKRYFEMWEFLSLSVLGSILVFPFLLLIEFILFGYVYTWFPLFNILTLSCVALLLILTQKTHLHPSLNIKTNWQSSYPFILTTLLLALFTGAVVTTYGALPDLDPYRWLSRYTNLFSSEQLDSVIRPLFGTFTFIGVSLLGLKEIFPFYKFVFPFLLSTISLPAWLVARQFTKKNHRLVFMLLVFTSPVILLYGTTSMPNTVLIILAYYFLFLLLYSSITKDSFFFYVAGVITLLGFFYHETAVLFFFPWFVAFLMFRTGFIFKDIRLALLLILLVLTNFWRLDRMIAFVTNWLPILYGRFLVDESFNPLFPASYRNIDQNLMGWPGTSGVLKYYAFHVGPIVISILVASFVLCVTNKKIRSSFLSVFKDPALLTLAGVFSIYFTIAEILPRYPNVGLLPDRAWVFGGIFSILFAYLILKSYERLPRFVVTMTVILMLVVVGGALYVNSLKKYLITPAQLRSAHWIQEHLPDNRLFFSSGNKNLLPVHADSRLIRIPENAYCDTLSGFTNVLEEATDFGSETSTSKRALQLSDTLDVIARESKTYQLIYTQASTPNEREEIFQEALHSLEATLAESAEKTSIMPGVPLVSLQNEQSFPLTTTTLHNSYTITVNDKLYVYFSRINPKNPYGGRPYTTTTWGFSGCPDGAPFIFDQHPEKFKRIYNDHEEVIIWEVLKPYENT